MGSLLAFINRVRMLRDLELLGALALLGTEPDDEERCVLASALGLHVAGSEHPDWSCDRRWVMRLDDS